jgi:ATP-binding cassette subfamily C (CFTR/MRP) protein 4
VTLSGGQKARVNLARAVYRKADVYILDDPLSAVDAVVGRRLFQTCMSGVLKNSIVVLVTHHLQYAQLTDAMLVVDKVH